VTASRIPGEPDRREADQGKSMPFVNIRIVEGHSKERKDEIARRVCDAISDVTKLPRDAIWVVFEDVSPDDWYVGDESVRRIRAKKT
jgi:4-oxalocrotonate tautomerase